MWRFNTQILLSESEELYVAVVPRSAVWCIFIIGKCGMLSPPSGSNQNCLCGNIWCELKIKTSRHYIITYSTLILSTHQVMNLQSTLCVLHHILHKIHFIKMLASCRIPYWDRLLSCLLLIHCQTCQIYSNVLLYMYYYYYYHNFFLRLISRRQTWSGGDRHSITLMMLTPKLRGRWLDHH